MAYADRALRGVGGWLAFFVLTLALVGPLTGLMRLVGLLSAPPPPAYAAAWAAVRAISVVEFALDLGVGWFLAYRLVYRRNPATPRIVQIGLWASALLIAPAMVLLLARFGGVPLGSMLAAGSAAALGQGLVYALVWTLYLRRSVRVANTYAHGDEGELRAVFE